MSVLIIGGDKISRLHSLLSSLGVEKTHHWDSRRNATTHKKLPSGIDMVVMLTDFLNHNAMYHFKKEAKKSAVPFLCVKGLSGCCKCQITQMVSDLRDRNDTCISCNGECR
jgi:hypothetical protein